MRKTKRNHLVLWRLRRLRFFLLCVAILARFLFFPQGIIKISFRSNCLVKHYLLIQKW